MHNDFLQNCYDNFDPDQYPSNLSVTQKIDVVNEFNKSYLATLGLTSADLSTGNTAFDASKHLLDLNETYDKMFVNTGILSGYDGYEMLSYLKEKGAIDEFEQDILGKIIGLCFANKAGNIDAEGLKDELIALRQSWNAQEYKKCDNTGIFSAYILSIGLNSVEWWIDHPDAYSTGERIAPWVAADITGALWGGFMGICGQVLNQPVRPGGPSIDINWGSVAWAATMGAVGSSTGLVGRLTKWIFG